MGRESHVLIFEALHETPAPGNGSRYNKGVRHRGKIQCRRRTGRCLPEKVAQSIPQAVAKLGVEAEPLGRRMQRAGAILVPILGNLDRRGIGRAAPSTKNM
jgi:hypothetical protein